MFFEFIIRFFIELSLETTICFMINVLIMNVDSFGEKASLLISFIFLAAIISISIMLPIFIIKNIKVGNKQKVKISLGEIAEGFNFKAKPRASAFYHSFFVWRRLVFVATVFGFGSVNLQHSIHLFITTNMLYLSYLIS